MPKSPALRNAVGRTIRLLCGFAVVGMGTAFSDDASPGLTEAEFHRLHEQLELKGGMWDLDWKCSVTEARRQALAEKKPIFMVVNTGNCLGYV